MPKTIESRSLSAPPASSPKTPNRLVHPLSTQLFPPPVPPQQQPLSPKHAWRRRWAKSTRFSRKDVHVRLDKGMELKSVRISTRSEPRDPNLSATAFRQRGYGIYPCDLHPTDSQGRFSRSQSPYK
ncbi:hypothetical protein RSAG8_01834, partial [Rhizoctonia solani AG-8 WAC10335]